MQKTLAALVLAATMTTTAHAQPGDHVALGAGIGFNTFRDGAFSSGNPFIVPEYHFGLSSHSNRQGLSFGLTGGISYLAADRSDFIGGFETRSGRFSMISAMV